MVWRGGSLATGVPVEQGARSMSAAPAPALCPVRLLAELPPKASLTNAVGGPAAGAECGAPPIQAYDSPLATCRHNKRRRPLPPPSPSPAPAAAPPRRQHPPPCEGLRHALWAWRDRTWACREHACFKSYQPGHPCRSRHPRSRLRERGCPPAAAPLPGGAAHSRKYFPRRLPPPTEEGHWSRSPGPEHRAPKVLGDGEEGGQRGRFARWGALADRHVEVEHEDLHGGWVAISVCGTNRRASCTAGTSLRVISHAGRG